MDLLTFFTTHYLDKETGRQNSPLEAEWSLHVLQTFLEPSEESRRGVAPGDILGSYLQLSVQDLDSIPVFIHEWFLEQICMFGIAAYDIGELDTRIARIYFLADTGLYQYLCLSALLVLDERREPNRTHTESIWNFILNRNNFEGRNKAEMLEQVANILLDVGQAGNAFYADRALRQLWRALGEHKELSERVVHAILQRAEAAGGERGRALFSIVEQDRF